MTKADIVERIYERAKASKKDASDVVDLVFELIKARLEAGEKVKLSGFVDSAQAEQRAIEVARGVEGAHDVEDALEIRQ